MFTALEQLKAGRAAAHADEASLPAGFGEDGDVVNPEELEAGDVKEWMATVPR